MPSEGDHGAIVGAKMRRGEMHLRIELCLELMAKAAVGADAARHHEFLHASFFERPRDFDVKRIDNRLLEARSDVGGGAVVKRRTFGDELADRRLESTKTQIKAGPVGHGPR